LHSARLVVAVAEFGFYTPTKAYAGKAAEKIRSSGLLPQRSVAPRPQRRVVFGTQDDYSKRENRADVPNPSTRRRKRFEQELHFHLPRQRRRDYGRIVTTANPRFHFCYENHH
jgi:hypothetical protein